MYGTMIFFFSSVANTTDNRILGRNEKEQFCDLVNEILSINERTRSPKTNKTINCAVVNVYNSRQKTPERRWGL